MLGFVGVGLCISAVFYSLVLALLYFSQEKLIFVSEKLAADHSFRFQGEFEERWVEFDGARVHSLLFKIRPSKGVILYFHGNAGNLEGWGNVAAEIAARSRWDVWIVDYYGYGKSPGSIRSEEQLHRVAKALWEAASSEYRNVLIYGRSIGTGIATKLAAEKGAAGLVLEMPYTSLTSLAKKIFPLVPSTLHRA